MYEHAPLVSAFVGTLLDVQTVCKRLHNKSVYIFSCWQAALLALFVSLRTQCNIRTHTEFNRYYHLIAPSTPTTQIHNLLRAPGALALTT